MTRLVKYEPFESCSRFEICSVNDCPLDPGATLHAESGKQGRSSIPGDPETRCRAHRSTRESVAVAYGYSPEWARTHREVRRDAKRARWLALPLDVRESRLKARTAMRPKSSASDPDPDFDTDLPDDPGSEGGDSGGQSGGS
mgnify:FL=1